MEELKYAIEGSLILDGNHTITELPEDFYTEEGPHIEGVLSLQYCTSLQHLPERLTVEEALDFSYSGIEELPQELFVADNIVGSYSCLRSIAHLSTVQRNLILSHCETLEEMPKSLLVNGDLDLSYCLRLKQLPQKLMVRGNLYLQHTQVSALPQQLLVGGDICLSGTPITELPADLRVGGFLDVSDCSMLSTLPSELHVRTFLNLFHSGVESFTEAEGLQVGGVIVNPSGSLITKQGGTLKAIPSLTDEFTSDLLLQKSPVPLNAVFMGNRYFVSYQNKLWRITFGRNDFYVLEDLCSSWADTSSEYSVLYKGTDGRYTLETLDQLPSTEFMESWYGQLLYGN